MRSELLGVLAEPGDAAPMGVPRRSGLLPMWGPGKFASDLKRVPVPGVDRDEGDDGSHSGGDRSAPGLEDHAAPTADRTVPDADRAAEGDGQRAPHAAVAEPGARVGPRRSTVQLDRVTRQAAARALAALDAHLPDDWADLLNADRFPALLIRLERARRLRADPAFDDALRLVAALQEKVLAGLFAEFESHLKAEDLERADAALRQARAVADDHPRLASATAELARAHDDRRASLEGQLKLERARELAGPPHRPRRLKQALKLYEDLLRRVEHYPALRPAFDLIRDERDEVGRRIQEADSRESERRTAIAIGEIDGLVATLDAYLGAGEDGSLEPDYAREQIDLVERLIGERLAPKMQEFLEDTDVLAEDPRDADVALERLREHKRLWQFLPAEVRAVVERREATLVELIRRRAEVLADTERAVSLIDRGEYVEAIVRLGLQARLHARFRLDVQGPIRVAADALAQRLRHRLDAWSLLLADPYAGDDELDRADDGLRAVDEQLAPVVEQAPQLVELRDRVEAHRGALRRLKGRLARFDRQVERCRQTIDQGRVGQARRLVERLGDDVPPQRKAHLVDLKVELDIAIEEDEVEARLRLLALTDVEAARAWAEQHYDHPACRRHLLDGQTGERTQAIDRLEREGRFDDALRLALALRADASPDRRLEVDALLVRLQAVARDAAEVERRLEAASALSEQAGWAEVAALLSDDLEVSGARLAEWRTLRNRAQAAIDRAEIDRLEAELDRVRAAREVWQARPTPPGDCLVPPVHDPPPDEAKARLDEALRALERLRLGDDLRARLDAGASSGRGLLRRLALERRLCAAESDLARFDFDAARVRLDAADEPHEPSVERVRLRLRRVEFGRLFGHALRAGQLDRARALIDAYPASNADEATFARALADLHARIDGAIETTAGALDPSAALGCIRAVRSETTRFVETHPHTADVLEFARRRLDEALVGAVDALFEALRRDLLPGAVLVQVEVSTRIAEEPPPIAALVARQAELQSRLRVEGRELLEWIEAHTGLEMLAPGQLADIEARLSTLEKHVERDPQFERCRRRIRQIRVDLGRQIDARRRHGALIEQALTELDAAALDEACRLEHAGLVDGERAERLRASWQQAEPVVGELQRAMTERAFDRVERLLDRLQQAGSAAHLARLDLAHPFEPGQRLPRGADAVRALLPSLRTRAEQAVAARAAEVQHLDRALDDLHLWLRRAVAAAPACPTAAEREAFVASVCQQLNAYVTRLARQIETLSRSASAGTGSSLRALADRLPPRDPAALRTHVTDIFARYRADHAAVVALSHAERSVIRGNRSGLQLLRRRWDGVDDFVRLVESLLRLAG